MSLTNGDLQQIREICRQENMALENDIKDIYYIILGVQKDAHSLQKDMRSIQKDMYSLQKRMDTGFRELKREFREVKTSIQSIAEQTGASL